MSYTKFLKWALLGGLALVFFVPFIIADGGGAYQNGFNMYIPFPGSFFPFITGKNFMFRMLVELLAGLYIVLALREPKYRPRTSTLLWVFGAFVLWMGFATMFSVDPTKSFWSNFERMEGYLTVLHLFVYFLIVGAVASAEEWWDRLFQVSIVSSALMGVYALLQLAGALPISSQSGPRVDGTFGNATYLAVFMLFGVFITLFMLVRQRKSMWAQIFYGVALVLQVTTLYYTQTRGALLGLLGGLILAGLYIVWKGRDAQWQPLRKVALVGIGVIAVVVVGFFALRTTSFVKNSGTLSRFSSISLSDQTTTARFQVWNMALQGVKEKPLVGWGQENFNFVFNKYYSPEMYSQEQWFDRAHNQFLDWLIAGGLPAFALYIAFFVLSVLVIFRSRLSVPEQAVLIGLLAAYAFNNLFVFDDLVSSVYFVTFLAFFHSLSKGALPGSVALSRPLSDKGIAVAAPFVMGGALLLIWVVNIPGLARAEGLLVALTPQVGVSDGQGGMRAAQKDPKARLQEFQTALDAGVWPGTPLGRQEATEQMLQYASGIAAAASVDPAVKQDTFTATQNATVAMLAARPHDARLELFYGAFLDTFGKYPEALESLTSALVDSPLKQQIMFEKGVVYLNANDTQNAQSVLKTAFDEAPGYRDARILYAAALTYSGNQKSADALLVEAFGTVLVDDSRLLQVYTNKKLYDRVVGIWKARIEQNPQNTQSHLGLAAAYFTSGNKTAAIAELNRAAQLDPALAAQVQSVITQIQNGTLAVPK
ncbi:MAG: O-antigen ligase family protein [Candidatus Adlerbacteria bacterium]